MIRQGSDHTFLLVQCNTEEEKVVKPFKVLNFWVKHPQFQQVVQEAWKIDFVGNPFTEFHAKLKYVKRALAVWRKKAYGNFFERVATLEDIISVWESQSEINPPQENKQELKKAEAELTRYWVIEGGFWRQKSSLKWFKEGDRNTKFFHSLVRGNRNKLNIFEIEDKTGILVSSKD